MNLIYIHSNFPGQFIDIAPFVAKNIASRTIFLTASDNPQQIRLEGVEVVRFKTHRQPSSDVHRYLHSSEKAVLLGQAVLRAVDQLCNDGFVPDVAIVHGGEGLGLYLKTLLPDLRLISYMEWYFNPHNSNCLFDKFSVDDSLYIQTRNWPIVQELMVADEIVTPTQWQRQQFPLPWRKKIHVIFDGIDTRLFRPAVVDGPLHLKDSNSSIDLLLESDTRILSFATRGMEPLRGFPEFMRAAAVAQQADLNLHVVVAGRDCVAYSYQSPHQSGSWKDYMIEELDGQLDLSRIHFVGLVTYSDLVQLYRRSNLHCYFTRPYVVSWSVFEAAACGTRLLINNFSGLDEVFEFAPSLPPVNLDDQDTINTGVLEGLRVPRNVEEVPLSNLRTGNDLISACSKWYDLLKS